MNRGGWNVPGRLVAAWLAAFLAGAGAVCASEPGPCVLEVDVAIERGGTTGAFFDFGNGFVPEGASFAGVPPGKAASTIRFVVPTRPVRAVRIDPSADDAPALITGLRLRSASGEILARLDLRTLRPLHQIQSLVEEGGGVRVIPVPKADDPMLRLDSPELRRRLHSAMGGRSVGRGEILFVAAGFAALLIAAVGIAFQGLGPPGARLVGGALFCAVLGARLVWLHLDSRPVPFWDEWEGDALYLLIPFNGGFLDWGALIMPQWEHRILLTRLITLAGTVLNGEWDPRVAMTVSAVMLAAATALAGVALVATRRWPGVVAGGLLALGASLPFDFNNLLWGGQTQMYGLVLMAVVTIALAAVPVVTPAVLAAALAGGVVSLFTMGAGPVGPGCAAGICLVRWYFERGQRRQLAALAAVCVLVALFGALMHASSPAHVPFYATSWEQFRRAFVGVMAWPLPPSPVAAGLVWLPWLACGVFILRRREANALEWLSVGLGAWGLVNAIALGYARQYEGPPFDSRFFTAFLPGAWAAIGSAAGLLGRVQPWRGRALPLAAGAAVASLLLWTGSQGIAGARENGAARAEIDHRIRIFLATGERQPLLDKPPHHRGDLVVDRLAEPLLQQVLPAPYRRALAARAGGASSGQIEAGPVTIAARTLMKAGVFIALLGWMGFGAMVWRGRPGVAAAGS